MALTAYESGFTFAIALSQTGMALTGNMALLVSISGMVRKFEIAINVSMDFRFAARDKEMLPMIIPNKPEINNEQKTPGIPVMK